MIKKIRKIFISKNNLAGRKSNTKKGKTSIRIKDYDSHHFEPCY